MHDVDDIPLSSLLLDQSNPRLGDPSPTSQQATYTALAKLQGSRMIALAEHIVENGMDPSAPVTVVPTGDRRKRYRVIEGNRRVLALKALETPTIVSAAGLARGDMAKLHKLSTTYAEDPVDVLRCVIFTDEAEAYRWAQLRHTGTNNGAGLWEWGADEQDRAKSRHGDGASTRKPAGQVIDFIDELDGPPETKKKVLTNVQRMINTVKVREAFGIEIDDDGKVVSHFPAAEVAKPLRRLIHDLRTDQIRVKNIYDTGDRLNYLATYSKDDLPDPRKRSRTTKPLDQLATETPPARPSGRMPAKKKAPAKPMSASMVPADCKVDPTSPRISDIYNELVGLEVEKYPNAAAVLLRVFLELSVDHEIEVGNLLTEQQRRSDSLAKRMKLVADTMHGAGRIPAQLKKAVEQVADSGGVVLASTQTFNQFVHNKYSLPKPVDLRAAWKELQPFFESIWS